jgi:uncharacterized iron-regulated protein
MKIQNDYQALDKAINEIEQAIEALKKSSKTIIHDLNNVQGWKDSNYQSIKTAIEEKKTNLDGIITGLDSLKSELSERSKLIKKYYAVTF